MSITLPSPLTEESYSGNLSKEVVDQDPTKPQIIVTSIPPSQVSTSSISLALLGEPVQSSFPAQYTSQYGIQLGEDFSLKNRPPTPRPPMFEDLGNSSKRPGTPNSLLINQSTAHIPSSPSPAESELSIASSAASRVIHAPVASSTPRRSHILIEEEPEEPIPTFTRRVSFPGEGAHLKDPPPHAAFVTRRTSIGTWRASGRPMMQPESFTQVSVIPEDNKEVVISAVPPKSRSSTEESRHTPEGELAKQHSTRTPSTQEHQPLSLTRRGLPIVQEVVSRMQKTSQEPVLHHTQLPEHIQSRILTSRHLREMFDDLPPRPPLGGQPPEDPDPYSFDDDNSSNNRPPLGRPRPTPGPPGVPDPHANQAAARAAQPFRPAPIHFDTKLKNDLIPEWDRDPKALPKWVIVINNIAEYSEYARQQLGQQVPLQFTGRAQQWFTALN
ncbi:hypothetical protein CTheo_8838 [Ceratobasidium theobromae]|uniref:Uncharacterized protein n=1 Tax=Ceratobasidium theobromae TaxID=1582974 RepID=A0A5N5Q8G0_9AGAM|nr:hypothetical protein CTheo_8838 [Ceratobasidium theobromae]